MVRVIDALAVHKAADGSVETLHGSQLSTDEQAEFGAVVGGLIGLGLPAWTAPRWAPCWEPETVAERGGVFSDEQAWDVVEDIPPDTAGLPDPHRAPLGHPLARCHRAGRWIPARIGVHQPARSRGAWSRRRRGGGRAGRRRARRPVTRCCIERTKGIAMLDRREELPGAPLVVFPHRA